MKSSIQLKYRNYAGFSYLNCYNVNNSGLVFFCLAFANTNILPMLHHAISSSFLSLNEFVFVGISPFLYISNTLF